MIPLNFIEKAVRNLWVLCEMQENFGRKKTAKWSDGGFSGIDFKPVDTIVLHDYDPNNQPALGITRGTNSGEFYGNGVNIVLEIDPVCTQAKISMATI